MHLGRDKAVRGERCHLFRGQVEPAERRVAIPPRVADLAEFARLRPTGTATRSRFRSRLRPRGPERGAGDELVPATSGYARSPPPPHRRPVLKRRAAPRPAPRCAPRLRPSSSPAPRTSGRCGSLVSTTSAARYSPGAGTGPERERERRLAARRHRDAGGVDLEPGRGQDGLRPRDHVREEGADRVPLGVVELHRLPGAITAPTPYR